MPLCTNSTMEFSTRTWSLRNKNAATLSGLLSAWLSVIGPKLTVTFQSSNLSAMEIRYSAMMVWKINWLISLPHITPPLCIPHSFSFVIYLSSSLFPDPICFPFSAYLFNWTEVARLGILELYHPKLNLCWKLLLFIVIMCIFFCGLLYTELDLANNVKTPFVVFNILCYLFIGCCLDQSSYL